MRALVLLLALSLPAAAQDADTLADIRQELAILVSEIDGLRRELSTTGAPEVSLPASALERIDALEAELRRLTSQTEALTGRVEAVVRDGTNRIGDLEFRLVELEGGDLSALGETSTLGGEAAAIPAVPQVAEPAGAELAIGEQADFDRAVAAFDAGAFAEAAGLFESFAASYPGGPLTGRAAWYRGRALEASNDYAGAARAYLAAFSGNPNGGEAPDALRRLGAMLSELGQPQEACVTWGEVQVRFPGTDHASEAQRAAEAAGCP